MIATTEQLVQEYIKDAIECAKNENQPKLVSLVKKVRPIDPLIFYANGHDQFYKERFFWKDPNSYYTFVGLGYAHTICTNAAKERYFHIENEWKRFIKEDFYKNNQIFPDGTGPLLFGGFSFDPN
ncbi:isochorismate synthase, partial [Priestia megaterium]